MDLRYLLRNAQPRWLVVLALVIFAADIAAIIAATVAITV